MPIKWVTERPEQSGNYWFRPAENKPPQVVRVQGGKVTFRSGKTKNIAHIQGQWGGVVTSSIEPIREYSSSKAKTETWPKLIGKLLIGAIIGAILYEPYFSYVGEEKSPEIVEEIGPAQNRISITVYPIFRNWGLKPGHIENAEFSHRELHLYPENVKLNYCSKTPILLLSVLSGKTMVCNFTATIDPRKHNGEPIWFQVSYFGPGGHEIHQETYSATPHSAEGRGGK